MVDYNKAQENTVLYLHREFNPNLLIEWANYFDRHKLEEVAQMVDSLRLRVEQLRPKTIEVQSVPTVEGEIGGEMLEPIPGEDFREGVTIGKAKSRAPFGVTHEEGSLVERLNKVLEWAKKQKKRKQLVINEAMVKAKTIIDASYEELKGLALRHTEGRLERKTGLSPEEIKRIEAFRKNTTQDFERILRDKLKRRK